MTASAPPRRGPGLDGARPAHRAAPAEASRLLDEGKATEAVVALRRRAEARPPERARRGREADGPGADPRRHHAAEPRGELPRGQGALRGRAVRAGARPPHRRRRRSRRTQQARQLLEKARQVVEGMRKQKDMQATIDTLMAQGERLLQDGQFPEAQVAFEGVLRLDAGLARAKERLTVAERRTREALFARWFPNEGPGAQLLRPSRRGRGRKDGRGDARAHRLGGGSRHRRPWDRPGGVPARGEAHRRAAPRALSRRGGVPPAS